MEHNIDFYKAIADCSPNFECLLDHNFQLLYISSRCKEYTGYTSDELMAMDPISIIYYDDQRNYRKQLIRLKERNTKPLTTSCRIITKAGKIKWMEHTFTSAFCNNEFIGYRLSNNDVTEKVRCQKIINNNLKQQQVLSQISGILMGSNKLNERIAASLKTICEHLNVCCSFIYREAQNSESSDYYFEYSNQSEKQECSDHIKYIWEHDTDFKAQLFEQGQLVVSDTGEQKTRPNRIFANAGVKAYMVFPLIDQNVLLGVIGIEDRIWLHDWKPSDQSLLQNVAAQLSFLLSLYESAQKLKSKEEKLKFCLHAAGEGTWEWDIKNDHITCDEEWAAMFEYSKEQIPGNFNEWIKKVHPQDRKRIDDYFKNYLFSKNHLSSKNDHYEIEYRIKHNNGRYIWVMDHGQIVTRDIHKNVVKAVGTTVNIHRLKKSELELKKSKSNFEEFFNTVKELFFIVDESGKMVHHNKMAQEIFFKQKGNKPAQFMDLFSLEEQPKILSQLKDALTGKAVNFIMDLSKNEGLPLSYEFFAYPGRWNNKDLVFIASKNIASEQKMHKLWRSTFYYSPDYVMLSTIDEGRLVEINRQFLSLVNDQYENVIGKTADELGIKYEIRFSRSQVVQELETNGAVADYEITFNLPDGTPRTGIVSACLIHIDKRKYILSILNDITDRKRYEVLLKDSQRALQKEVNKRTKELKEQNDRLHLFFDTIPDLICRWLPDTTLLDVNCAYAEYSGLENEDLLGTKWKDQLDAPDKEGYLGAIKHTLKQPQAFTYEGPKVDIKGVTNWFQWINIPILDESGKVIEFISSGRNITDKKNHEETLIEAKNKAELSERSKTAFLNTISHELRTPLNAIIGFSDLSAPDMPAQELFEYMHYVNRSGKHLLKLIEEIFELTKLESGEYQIEKKNTNLSYLVLDLYSKYFNCKMLKGHQNKLLVDFDKSLDFMAYADPASIFSVMEKLLINAIEFTHNGEITIGLKYTSSHELCFSVSDTGCGIDKANWKRIFEHFSQVQNMNTRTHQGLGVGLASAKKIIELMGGTIFLDSLPEKGSRFYFTLPYQKPVQRLWEQFHQLEQARILIVKESKYDSHLLKTILQKNSALVETYASIGELVIKDKPQLPTHAIIIETDGYKQKITDAIQYLIGLHPEVPLFITSTYLTANHRRAFFKAGARDVFVKPYAASNLLEKINSII